MSAAGGQATARAPGRVNLLGEHTDYNDGFVLPTAIPQHTTVALRVNGSARFRVRSTDLDGDAEFALGAPPAAQFARYVYGCLHEVAARGADVPGLDIEIASDVPMGVGLSSSAALEVAMLRALRSLLGLAFDDVEVARMAQRAEIEHAGVHCGIMDQMASSLAAPGRMLFLDTRSLQRRVLPMPADAELLVLDSGISRSLAASGYNTRRAECEQAAAMLGVVSLRDVEDPAAVERLPEPLRQRARHVVSENTRVLQAIDCEDAAAFGRLMNASHASLRDDYAVSVPPLDTLVALLQAHPGVHGARLTGAGFGGACVALCHAGQARAVADDVLARYRDAGHAGRLLVPTG
ncbi:MAG TPA: galactokinase [Lysobacter sp.]|nr:galactokinase [Lysobacter sp.]